MLRWRCRCFKCPFYHINVSEFNHLSCGSFDLSCVVRVSGHVRFSLEDVQQKSSAAGKPSVQIVFRRSPFKEGAVNSSVHFGQTKSL
jgi:hypothetical protein